MTEATSEPCSVKAEQPSYSINARRMMGLETAAAILGGAELLANEIGISSRGVRYKFTGDRGVSASDLRLAAAALEKRAAWILEHARKLREEAA